MKNIISISLLLLSLKINCYSQITNSGTDFWFGFTEVYDTNLTTGASYAVYVSSFVNTSGTISIPGQGFSQNFSVVPGIVTTINLPPPLVRIITSEIIEAKAIHVISNDNIVVYAHTYHTYRNDASLILPVPALGDEYFVASYNPITTFPSEFIVISSGTSVTVEITPSANTIGGKPANIPFNVTLNSGELYQVQSVSGDMTGTKVRALNPGDKFSVLGGAQFPQVPASCSSTRDPIYEQLFPVSSWGMNYVFVPTPLLNDDICRVLASQNGTNVNINGTQVATLNAGQFYEQTITTPSFISANLPLSVGRYLKGSSCVANPVTPGGSGLPLGDPAMVMIDANEQMYLDTITFYASGKENIDSNYLQVITRTPDVNTIFLDGNNIGSYFSILTTNPAYSHMYVRVDTGAHTLESNGCGFLAYVTGLGRAESYAYAAGVSLQNISMNIPDSACIGSNIQFSGGSFGSATTWNWNFGDGNTSTLQNPSHAYSNVGNYTVTLVVSSSSGCTDTITKPITIYSCSSILSASVASTNLFCNGQCIGTATVTPINGSSPYTYNWNSSPIQTTQVATGLCAGAYTVLVTDALGTTAIDSVLITQPSALTASFTITPILCNGDSSNASISVSGGIFPYTYSWGTTPNQTTSTATGLTAGNYSVAVTDSNGCVTTQTISIIQPTALSVSVTTTNVSCNGGNNGSASLVASGGIGSYTYSWNTSPIQTAQTATGLTAGNYSVNIIDSNGCSITQTISLTQPAAISASITATGTNCNVNTGTASVNANGGSGSYTYSWNPSSQTAQTATGLGVGNYTCTITDANGCTALNTISITQINGITASIAANVTITLGQSATLTAAGGTNYSWSNGSTANLIIVFPSVTTIYCVTAADTNNCSDTVCATVTVEPLSCGGVSLDNLLFLPNAFSPNGDGENDAWKILFDENYQHCVKDVFVAIYDRWGIKVAELNHINESWDGFLNGIQMNSSVFIFYMNMTLSDGTTIIKKGNITLLR